MTKEIKEAIGKEAERRGNICVTSLRDSLRSEDGTRPAKLSDWAAEQAFNAEKESAQETLTKGAEIALSASQWIRVEDRLPEPDTLVLIANDQTTCTARFDKDWGQDGWWLLDNGKDYEIPLRGGSPTHWQPLFQPSK